MGIWTPTNDDAIPADDQRLLMAKAWDEGFEAGWEHGNESAKWFAPEKPENPYLSGDEKA